jgi:hypothetical protein
VDFVQSIHLRNKTKQNEILIKPKDVLPKMFHKIPWNIIKIPDEIYPTFVHSLWHHCDLSQVVYDGIDESKTTFSKYLTNFPS